MSKADSSAISNGILLRLPRLMQQGKSSHKTRLQSPKVLDLEFIKHVSEQDSGLEIGDEKIANKQDLKAENSSLMDENQTLKNKLEAQVGIANDKQSYEQRIKELKEHHRKSLDEMEKENWSQKEKEDLIFDLRQKILRLKNSKGELATEGNKLELDIQSMEASHKALIGAIDKNYQAEKKLHEDQVQELKDVIKAGKELITKQEIQIKTLQEELHQKNNESKALKESNKTAMEEHQKLITNVEAKYSKVFNDLAEMRKSRLATCVALSSEKEELENQIAIMEKEKSDLNVELLRCNENFEKERRDNSKANERNDSYHAKVQEKDEEIRKLQEKLRRRKGIRRLLPF